MNKQITLLRMFEVSLNISDDPFILSIHDCESGKTAETTYDLTKGSAANQAVMYLNRKGIMITYMALSTGESVALLTEDLTTDL